MNEKLLNFIENQPITPSERSELLKAIERQESDYWMVARTIINSLCKKRKQEKIEKKLKYLLTDDKMKQLVPVDSILLNYISELYALGYSSFAICEGFKYAVSSRIICQRNEDPYCRKRGQVIELMDDLAGEFDVKKWRNSHCGIYRRGNTITDEEKEKFREYKNKGYTVFQIAEMTGRCPKSIRKWTKDGFRV